MRRILLEICAGSVEDCITAEAGGADRVELNSALAVGGLTPSLGALIEVKARTTLPVMAMARPRSGGFNYSDIELATMQRDIDLLLQEGADGIVFGVLDGAGLIDVPRCRLLVEQVKPRQVVFHRAFDVVPDAREALETLIDLGIDRVMTSGQEANAYNGAAMVASLCQQAESRIEILPAGGINRFTVHDILTRTGCDQVHASLSGQRVDASTAGRPQIRFGAATLPPEDRYTATDPAAVEAMRRLLETHWAP